MPAEYAQRPTASSTASAWTFLAAKSVLMFPFGDAYASFSANSIALRVFSVRALASLFSAFSAQIFENLSRTAGAFSSMDLQPLMQLLFTASCASCLLDHQKKGYLRLLLEIPTKKALQKLGRGMAEYMESGMRPCTPPQPILLNIKSNKWGSKVLRSPRRLSRAKQSGLLQQGACAHCGSSFFPAYSGMPEHCGLDCRTMGEWRKKSLCRVAHAIAKEIRGEVTAARGKPVLEVRDGAQHAQEAHRPENHRPSGLSIAVRNTRKEDSNAE